MPRDWQFQQHFDVPAAGLVKLSLPVQTLDRALPDLEDVRIYDEAGRELSWVIERPRPAGKVSQNAKAFQVALNPGTTVITIEAGLAQPLDGLTLESPAASFIKAVQIAGSADGRTWRTLAQGQPIFRQPGGASHLGLTVPPGEWPWLQLTVDDHRSQPIPFTGARVHATAGETAPSEAFQVTLAERHENPGETRLTLNLGAANLELTALKFETSEALFTRQVTLAIPRVVQDSIREETLAVGTIYRIAIEGQPSSANLTLSLESQVRSRELLVLIRNQDSPPLPVIAVRAERYPVYLVFLARDTGRHYLVTGNPRCAAPKYDLAALGANFKRAPVQPITLSPLADNPGYRPPEVLPGVQTDGTALDVSAWSFRKAIQPANTGVQQLELDLDVLARAAPDLADLRLLRDGKQVPYILEHPSISHSLAPAVRAVTDPKDPKLSRWILKLPRSGLPINRLQCGAHTQLFNRDVTLSEETADERGNKYRRPLATASWIQTPDGPRKEFFLTLDARPVGDTLFLETSNGDNPPIELRDFQFFYPATRVLFKANPVDRLLLHYGNRQVAPPRYDLSLVAGQLLAADKSIASLGPETLLKKPGWGENRIPSEGGVVFWAILALVVVVLLFIISRLLPKPPEPVS